MSLEVLLCTICNAPAKYKSDMGWYEPASDTLLHYYLCEEHSTIDIGEVEKSRKIKSQIESLNNRIALCTEEIKTLMNSCTHPFAIRTSHGDTGNWSKSDDRYWYEFHCPSCDKHWAEDQND